MTFCLIEAEKTSPCQRKAQMVRERHFVPSIIDDGIVCITSYWNLPKLRLICGFPTNPTTGNARRPRQLPQFAFQQLLLVGNRILCQCVQERVNCFIPVAFQLMNAGVRTLQQQIVPHVLSIAQRLQLGHGRACITGLTSGNGLIQRVVG